MLWLGLAGRLDAQASWTLRNQSSAPGDFLWSATDGNFGAVAVGDGGKILHSVDGRTWVQRESGTTAWIVAVTYGNGRYVAVGDGGPRANLSGANDTTGLALVEAYDVPNN